MDEQLIREHTAVLLDAYRELTGSTEIPGIGDFLKLREAAIHEGGIQLRGEVASNPTKPVQKIANPVTKEKTHTDIPKRDVPHVEEKRPVAKPQPQTQVKSKVIEPEVRAEENPLDDSPSAKDAFAMLRSIQDPWNG